MHCKTHGINENVVTDKDYRNRGLASKVIDMAIADVYDALVSKRCYKEPMSQEEAYKIIMESMGSHFDPALKDGFEKAYPSITQFYKQEC